MPEASDPDTPLLIVVTGRPASGKTTLAHALARELCCPAISRDELKEGLVNSIDRGLPEPERVQWHVYEAFFDALELLLSRGISVVAEAAFQHKLWAPKLRALREMARVKIILCAIDAAEARQRFIRRGLDDPRRVHYHGDRAVHAAKAGRDLPLGPYQPPKLDVPTLAVRTDGPWEPSMEEIVAFAGGDRFGGGKPASA